MPKILVIDDDPTDLSAIGNTLGAHGYKKVTLAASGSAAMNLIDGGALFDLVVTDILMPEMDGLELLRAIRKHAPEWSMLAITNATRWSSFDVGAVAAEMGANATIYKPWTDEQLVRAVSFLLHSRPA